MSIEKLRNVENYDINTKLLSNSKEGGVMVQTTIKLFDRGDGTGAHIIKSVTATSQSDTVEKAEDSAINRAIQLLGV